MTNRIALSAACLAFSALSFLSLPASAGLISAGDKLAYDQDTNLMWYTGFDLYGSFDNLNPMLAQLPRTTTIDSKRVLLDWSLAKLAQINTINLTDEDTFSIFTQYDTSYFMVGDAYYFFGFSGDLQKMEYWEDDHLVDTTLGINRAIQKSPDGTLCWYDEWMPFGDTRCGSTLDRSSLTEAGPSDYRVPFEVIGDTRFFWLTAEVRFVHSVPEPSSLLLLLGGLLGLAGFRRKSGY